ncbi:MULTISPECIES: acyltransferase domain-containing protein [unclassified Janthinobacterium]|uniref:acyltransferase domain-containing protein n=1 Tax=unclassified Janthinobacterium TaxID=2610881 RepID=UPI00034ABEF6|nr:MULTISPECIES: acyltransferase domain-containing protein [unclassified Janthinobacterium]MEC5160490.1 [acyl-carrier-protein] S-malonyltransferase [Janthinobacterium sp. CG_S6]
MSRRLLILCPGQGGQHAGMFDLARTHAGAAALLERIAVPAEPARLFANRVAQPQIVAAGLALWQAIRGVAPAPALVAGYSVGELTAYGVAGALAPDDAVALAQARAALMDACLEHHPGQALAAISGLRLQRVRELLAGDLYHVAIETGEDSCVAGGPAAALAALTAGVAAAGGRLKRLPVDVAAHTPYMAQAVAPFAAALRATGFGAQQAPVLSGIAACGVVGKAGAVEHLSRQLAEHIVWTECMDACAEAGIGVALELGPGAALSRMLQARHPGIACRSTADFRSLAGIARWLERHCE